MDYFTGALNQELKFLKNWRIISCNEENIDHERHRLFYPD